MASIETDASFQNSYVSPYVQSSSVSASAASSKAKEEPKPGSLDTLNQFFNNFINTDKVSISGDAKDKPRGLSDIGSPSFEAAKKYGDLGRKFQLQSSGLFGALNEFALGMVIRNSSAAKTETGSSKGLHVDIESVKRGARASNVLAYEAGGTAASGHAQANVSVDGGIRAYASNRFTDFSGQADVMTELNAGIDRSIAATDTYFEETDVKEKERTPQEEYIISLAMDSYLFGSGGDDANISRYI